MFSTLISVDDVLAHLHNPDWVVVDCRFSLQESSKGREEYLDGHIPGAFYAHQEEDLAGEIIPGKTGRHPLPPIERMVDLFSSWGIDEKVQVVVYDFKGGGMAVRLWWMLQWLGHEAVALMDGGWAHWDARRLPVSVEAPSRPPRTFNPRLQEGWIAEADMVDQIRQDPAWRLVDSRAYERYLGREEPIDPVAGRIPGAVHHFFMDNVDENGFFKDPAILRSKFLDLTGGVEAGNTVFYCGSGVTSCHNVLAMRIAGLGMARIYPGSWSEWIIDPKRPIAKDEI